MSAAVCECGHGKSDHVLLSRECRNPDPAAEDCVCTKFRPAKVAETDLHAVHRASSRGGDSLGYGPCVACGELWPCKTGRAIPVPAAGGIVKGSVIAYGFEPPIGTESTSAALARVTAERDEALATAGARAVQLIASRNHVAEARAERDQALVGHQAVLAEMDELRLAHDSRMAALRHVGEQRNALASLAEGAADVVTAYDCLYCRTCYGRYFEGTDAAANHEHPLVAVTVTITLREGHR